MSEAKLSEIIKSQLPQRMLRAINEGISDIYRKVVESTLNIYPRELAYNDIPYKRKTEIDHLLYNICQDYPSISGCFKQNTRKNYNYFIMETKNLRIVQNHVQWNNNKPRDAEFRKEMEELNLFGDQFLTYSLNNVYNAIIIHSSYSVFSKNPSFIKFYFPNLGSIDIDNILEKDTERIDNFANTEIDDLAIPKLRNSAAEK